MATLLSRPVRTAVLLAAIVLVAAAARAEEAAAPVPGTEKERLKKARQEQAAERKSKETADRSAQRDQAAAAEKARLEKIGASGAKEPPEEQPGFYVAGEAMLTTVSGADRAVARQSDIVTSATTAEQLDTDPSVPAGPGLGLPDAYTVTNRRDVSLDYKSAVTPRLEIGWRRKSGGALSLAYWSFSGSSSIDVTSTRSFASTDPAQGGLVLGGIDNQGVENLDTAYQADPAAFSRPFGSPAQLTQLQTHGADSVSASGKFDATRLDLQWARTALARKRLEVGYSVGLTRLTMERSEKARFTWRSFERLRVLQNALSVEDVAASARTTGIGPSAGAWGRLGLNASRSFSIRLGLQVTGVKATQKLAFSDEQLFSQDTVPTQIPQVFQSTTNDNAGQFVTLLEGDAAVEKLFGKRLRVALGYRHADWRAALTEEHYPNAINTGLLDSRSVDLTFGGPYLRVGFFF